MTYLLVLYTPKTPNHRVMHGTATTFKIIDVSMAYLIIRMTVTFIDNRICKAVKKSEYKLDSSVTSILHSVMP